MFAWNYNKCRGTAKRLNVLHAVVLSGAFWIRFYWAAFEAVVRYSINRPVAALHQCDYSKQMMQNVRFFVYFLLLGGMRVDKWLKERWRRKIKKQRWRRNWRARNEAEMCNAVIHRMTKKKHRACEDSWLSSQRTCCVLSLWWGLLLQLDPHAFLSPSKGHKLHQPCNFNYLAVYTNHCMWSSAVQKRMLPGKRRNPVSDRADMWTLKSYWNPNYNGTTCWSDTHR